MTHRTASCSCGQLQAHVTTDPIASSEGRPRDTGLPNHLGRTRTPLGLGARYLLSHRPLSRVPLGSTSVTDSYANGTRRRYRACVASVCPKEPRRPASHRSSGNAMTPNPSLKRTPLATV